MSRLAAADDPSSKAGELTVALVGNPNVGKTSVFNRLTKHRAKTSNYSGTTVELKKGTLHAPSHEQRVRLIDLPGLFSLDTDSPEEQVAKSVLGGEHRAQPDAILIIVDGTNLTRSLFLARQVLKLRRPSIVAVNMVELARAQGIEIDFPKLSEKLGCPVVPISARTGEGFDELVSALLSWNTAPVLEVIAPTPCTSCNTCPYAEGHTWASEVAGDASRMIRTSTSGKTDVVDRFLTHPVVGPLVFGLTMSLVFALVFWLATIPMDWLEQLFGSAASVLSSWLPPAL